MLVWTLPPLRHTGTRAGLDRGEAPGLDRREAPPFHHTHAVRPAVAGGSLELWRCLGFMDLKRDVLPVFQSSRADHEIA